MLALPHSLDKLDLLSNPEEDFWSRLYPDFVNGEGWTFVLEDFDNWRTCFAKFWFFVAVEKSTKRPVSCIMLALDEASANGEETLYTMGYYYTDPEWRDSGVGSRLFWMLMAIVGNDNIGMNSGLHMVSRYVSLFGADKISDYLLQRIIIYLKDLAPPREVKGLVAKELHEINWEDVVAYDVTVCTRKREKYLRKLLEPSEDVFARIIVNEKGKVVGFGSIRGEVGGVLAIGPLYADSQDAARLMIDSIVPLINQEKYPSMHMVYPTCNQAAERLAQEVSGGKFETYPYTQPQFTKHLIPVAEMKVFSVTDVGMSYV